jgi:4-diphosphocytidyl-2-C-methyl-D-erythritol kinase
MITFPNAKINLGLHVVSKRSDGYHNLETVFYPVGWSDILEVLPSEKSGFNTSGLTISGNPEDNLCLKAYRLLQKDFGLPNVHIHLHKIVPMGAGLGGGSSDGAWTLRLLNEIFHLSLPIERLAEYASLLGSDCAFFLYDNARLGQGRGNDLSDFDVSALKGKFLVIVKPAAHVSTAEAYAGINPTQPKVSLQEILTRPISEWKNVLKNDFEESVFKKYPQLSHIKSQLYDAGALYASMSGSGSALYGVFPMEIDLKEKFPGMEYWSGVLK